MTGRPAVDRAGNLQAAAPVRQNRIQSDPSRGRVSSHGGREIEPRVRAPFEARLAYDFSSVRVHDDVEAGGVASSLRAQAVTIGPDVFFRSGRYAPQTSAGSSLLGHELAHVAQQGRGGASPDAEGRADRAAERVAAGKPVSRDALGGAPVSAQAKPEPTDQKPSVAAAKPDASKATQNDKQAPAGGGEHFSSTLDRFDFDSDALSADHLKAIDNLVFSVALHTRLLTAGKAAIAITGHTDTAGAESYNTALGQRRADKVMAALREAMKRQGLTEAQITAITANSAGEGSPSVKTKDNVKEPRNRRVVVEVTYAAAAAGPMASAPPTTTSNPPGSLAVDPFKLPRLPPAQAPSREWVQNQFEHDPLLKELPKFARDQLVTALKDGDELAATAIIGSLPLGDKKAAVSAAVKALLQIIKGRTFKPPAQPPVEPNFGPPQSQPPAPPVPGEHIFQGPKINLPYPFN